jgi:ATP-dependent helicase HrpB
VGGRRLGPQRPAGAALTARDPRPDLPIEEVLPDVLSALADHAAVVVEAPPGAGKTTRVPPALARAPWAQSGRVVVLEPRRVAARAAALRMATEAGEPLGRTIGLTTRDERHRSRETRVEVVTEGVLVRRLQQDPALPGTAVVVLDEFHERSLDADLALAFTREAQQTLRDDLRIVVMSATLDGARVAAALDGAPVVRSDGRLHPVAIEHVDHDPLSPLAPAVAAAVEDALAERPGDVLVFLPGVREITAVRRALRVGPDVDVIPLHGTLPPSEQDAALRPAPAGRRKVVLATDLAESSVTVPGVVTVVDAGLSREPRLDPRTGMSRLVTVRAAQASADQRAGRAGRTAAGHAVRLWSVADHAARDPHPRPEILTSDLTAAALQIAAWGTDVAALTLLDPPPPDTWRHAHAVLQDLGALDEDGAITPHGRALAEVPAHPRLAHLLVVGRDRGWGPTAAAVAALLGDRDVLRPAPDRPDVDLATRVRVLDDAPPPPGATLRRATRDRVRRDRRRLARLVGVPDVPADPEVVGAALALAYPDRVGVRRGARGRFLLANGRGATIDPRDPLTDAEFVVVADVDDAGTDARVYLAAAVELAGIRSAIADRIATATVQGWDDDRGDVVSERRETRGAVVLTATAVPADPDGAVAALLDGIRQRGLGLLPWDAASREFVARVEFVRGHVAPDWPSCEDVALLADLDEWLAPFLRGARRRADLARVPLGDALRARLGWDRVRRLDDLAPTHLEVPSGSRIRLDYSGEVPVLAVKLQELFGATSTPTVAGVPVLVHLLSPAGRPVQVTQDLAGFWERSYPAVRSELRGRYPKHPWPEDGATATPTRHTRRRRRN